MLQHPNIIEYYENFLEVFCELNLPGTKSQSRIPHIFPCFKCWYFFDEDKAMMIVMEYAAGGTLYDLLDSRVSFAFISGIPDLVR